jgi:hypothetical protein
MAIYVQVIRDGKAGRKEEEEEGEEEEEEESVFGVLPVFSLCARALKVLEKRKSFNFSSSAFGLHDIMSGLSDVCRGAITLRC